MDFTLDHHLVVLTSFVKDDLQSTTIYLGDKMQMGIRLVCTLELKEI